MYPFIVPQSKYFPLKLCAINFSLSLINDWIASVMCISPPLLGFVFFSLVKIDLGKMYLPITALFEGAFFESGFSITPLIR